MCVANKGMCEKETRRNIDWGALLEGGADAMSFGFCAIMARVCARLCLFRTARLTPACLLHPCVTSSIINQCPLWLAAGGV